MKYNPNPLAQYFRVERKRPAFRIYHQITWPNGDKAELEPNHWNEWQFTHPDDAGTTCCHNTLRDAIADTRRMGGEYKRVKVSP